MPTTLPTMPTTLPTMPTTLMTTSTMPTTLPTMPTTLPTMPTTLPTMPTTLPTTSILLPTGAPAVYASGTQISPNSDFSEGVENIPYFPYPQIRYWAIFGDASLVKYTSYDGTVKYGARLGEAYGARIRQGVTGSEPDGITQYNLGKYKAGHTYTFNIFLDNDTTTAPTGNFPINIDLRLYALTTPSIIVDGVNIIGKITAIAGRVEKTITPGIPNTITFGPVAASSAFIDKNIILYIAQFTPTTTNPERKNKSFIVSKVEFTDTF
jgi:hypothetical protein